MRINSDELIDCIYELLSPNEKRIVVWQKLGEKHCRVTFFDKEALDQKKEKEQERKRDMLFSIVCKADNDLVIVHCNTDHQLALSICLALLKKGLDVRCFGHDDQGVTKRIIFDTTVCDFCEFVNNLQNIANELNLALSLNDNPLGNYNEGYLLVRMKEANGRAKIIGILINPGGIFRVTILDGSIDFSYLISKMNKINNRLIIRETISTYTGKKVVTRYNYCH
jgi:hypothetical protein